MSTQRVSHLVFNPFFKFKQSHGAVCVGAEVRFVALGKFELRDIDRITLAVATTMQHVARDRRKLRGAMGTGAEFVVVAIAGEIKTPKV